MSEIANKKARPWDIFNINIQKVSKEIAEERLAICSSCKFFNNLTGTCKKCKCIMSQKVRLPHSECPIDKWGAVQIDIHEENNNDNR
jgi:hypothetical protein